MFKDFNEMLRVVIILCKDWPPHHQKKIGLAINACHSIVDDKDKCFRLYSSLKHIFWFNKKAIEEGFSNYLSNQRDEILKMLEYHDANCGIDFEYKNCSVCADIKNTLDNIHEEIYYERKES